MTGRFGGNVDDFIASEQQHIDSAGDGGGSGGVETSKPTMRPTGMSGSGVKSVASKPNFGVSVGKKPGGAFAKPGFAMMGQKKTVGGVGAGPPVISKGNFNQMGSGAPKMNLGRKRQQEDDFIENEMAQIQRRGGEEAIDQSAAQVSSAPVDRLLDSEDPTENSYASPERQLPQKDPYGMTRPDGAGAFQSRQAPERGNHYGAQGPAQVQSRPDEEKARVSPFVTPAQNNRMAAMPAGSDEVGAPFQSKHSSAITPNAPVTKAPLFQLKSGTGAKTSSAMKPALFASGSKGTGAGLFKKPGMMGLGKKKFQLNVQAPSENELKLIQKVETRLHAPKITVKKLGTNQDGNTPNVSRVLNNQSNMLSKASLNQVSGASLHEKRVADNFTRPMALKKTTQASLANQQLNPRPPSSIGRKPNNQGMLAQNSSGDDNYSDEYDQNDFEDEKAGDQDGEVKLAKLRKAMKREEITANKVVKKHKIQLSKDDDAGKPQLIMGPKTGKGGITMEQITREVASMQAPPLSPAQERGLNNPQQQPLQTLSGQKNGAVSPRHQPAMSLEDQRNMKAFAQQAVLKAGPLVDHEAAGSQETRAEELKELIGLGQEEFFDIFEMLPRTEMDVYDQKLLSGTHKLALVQTGSEDVEQETQTEDVGAHDKWNQAPDDVMIAYKQEDESVSFVTKKQKKDNDALNLEKFMSRAGPVMEQLVEENTKLRFVQVQDGAGKPTAIELKQTLAFPEEILIMLGDGEQRGSVLNITAVHMFETAPQAKCAVAYEVVSPRDDLGVVYLIILYSITANQVLRIMKCESEVTKMCTPQNDQILIVGTDVGSLSLYDLTAFEAAGHKHDFFDYEALLLSQHDPAIDQGDINLSKALKKIRAKFKVLGHTFATDSMEDYKHFSPIRQLEYVNKAGSSYAQIGVMDELGVVSQWSVMEIQAHLADKVGDFDLHLNMGGRFKLLENFSESMMFMPEIFENLDGMSDIGMGMELEFDPKDSNVFYFSTSGSLFKVNRKASMIPTKLITEGLGAPTALSMSDEGYLLVGFSCGSIAIYHNEYTSPITVWNNACKLPIVKINWSTVFNNGQDEKQTAGASRFMNRLCEFFVMDTAEDFYIWNITRSMDKPARVISFAQKHDSLGKSKLYTQSMTCADQTFFTAFATTDLAVKLYAMNFRKGSQINRQKVDTENKRSRKLLNTLPLTLQFMDAAADEFDYGTGDDQPSFPPAQSRGMDGGRMRQQRGNAQEQF